MLIVDDAPSVEARSKLIVHLIVEVQPSECPDAWIGLGNVVDKIFEMQSQAADAVEQEWETVSFGWLFFASARPFASESWERACPVPFVKNWSIRRKLMRSLQWCKQVIFFVNSCWSCSSFIRREELFRICIHWEEAREDGFRWVFFRCAMEKPLERSEGESDEWYVVDGWRRRWILVCCWSVNLMNFAVANCSRTLTSNSEIVDT